MGTWGPGIFDDDLAVDIQDYFDDCLSEGMSVHMATQLILEEFQDILNDRDEGPVVFLALAALQLREKALSYDIREKALSFIKTGRAIEHWKKEEPEDLDERRKILEEFKNSLTSS